MTTKLDRRSTYYSIITRQGNHKHPFTQYCLNSQLESRLAYYPSIGTPLNPEGKALLFKLIDGSYIAIFYDTREAAEAMNKQLDALDALKATRH